MDFDKIERVFRSLALGAGEKIMEVYASDDFGVESKSDDSPVTRADQAADAYISVGLRAAFPDLALVTEEQAETHRQSLRDFIIVDPLDGTKEFVQRRGDFTVNIALVLDGRPMRGVVYAPAKQRLFYTRADGKSVEELTPFNHDEIGPQKLLSVAEADNSALRVVASKSHRDAATDAYISAYEISDLRSAGSSLKFCLVASGEADFYPRLGRTMEWDTAAGDAVLRGAGGQMVEFSTHKEFTYGKAGFENSFFIAYAPTVELIEP